MKTRPQSTVQLFLSGILMVGMLLSFGRPATLAASPQAKPAAQAAPLMPSIPSILQATDWCLAGSFNGWDNNLDHLADDGQNGDLVAGDGIFTLDYTIAAAGRAEWKIVECGNWANAYPANNAWVKTDSADRNVRFTFDTNNHASDAGWALLPAQNIVNVWDDLPSTFTAVGDFNGWINDDPNTLMLDMGHGIHRLALMIPNAGSHDGKVTATGTWDAFGAGGRSADAANVSFTTTTPNQEVIFLLDSRKGRLVITPNGSGTGNWCVAGGFNGWNNSSTPLYDDGTQGDLLGGDGIFSLDYTLATAGREEFKIVECGNWGVAYPSDNAWVETTQPNQVVKLTFDSNDHSADAGWALLPAQNIANVWDDLPASFTAVGDFNNWTSDDPGTALESLAHGWLTASFPITDTGTYQGKVTRTGNWDDQYGADGRNKNAPAISFQVFTAGDYVRVIVDSDESRMAIIAPPSGGAGHDNNIFWNDLGHNSRDTLYRTPGGPVPRGTEVTLRLRAASNDLTAARVRVWNDRTDVQTMYPMQIAADDGTYEWWEVTLPASPDPTVYWYRFIAIDGTATAYYEDDGARTGGWGEPFGASQDNSWQLTMYDPAFQTPDWVKNAIVYQIFPDRFRDGDTGNDTPAGTFFYNDAGGTVYRSLQPDWNQYVCDPRAATTCSGTYSKNFYGGDLQGLVDKLDYLQSLGVTAIYLNPAFESPSNHKYDTTDYSLIDDNFGDLTLFQTLATEAHNRGMKIILDGVFNHTSSDSVYFDRYHRYAEDGACETESSPYRDWYFFTDVAPGSGTCVSSTGVPNAATYESWFGYDSLPKLNSANQEVRNLIWSGGSSSIARYWMQWADGWRLDVGGDVDPGTTNDPNNDYWEGFRNAVHQTNPEAYIVGEEWGNATSWTLGGEWDATMNYQFGSAILSFWRDSTFTDNDHNPGSSAGALDPIGPSELDERLLNQHERYAPEAAYAMLNLLDSHDTNRALFELDHNAAVGTDDTLLLNPNYDWSDAITRLKGVALLQMTLPGAPTIYYGDEVGLVGPVTYDGSTWQDDPYNRQPFPWLDESGTPFYTHLQSQVSQEALRSYYENLTSTRNQHPALRTGSLDTLLVDDANNLFAYGRKLADHTDAAVVITNRETTTQTVILNLSGYLPFGAELENALDNDAPYTVDGSGMLTIDVPGMSGALLVLSAPVAVPPAAVADLSVTGERDQEVDLGWSAVAGATSYDVYRSLLHGGGYTWIANTSVLAYTDTGLNNATPYYYVIVSRNDANGLVSGFSNEASGMPHYTIGWANLQWPPTISHTIGITPTETIYGQVWINGVTGLPGATPGLLAQVGFGAQGTQPTGWSDWVDATFNNDQGNNDEFKGQLLPEQTGVFDYVYRYSTTNGRDWLYADLNGPFTGTPPTPGVLTVNASSDTDAPATPQNLQVVDWSTDYISLAWEPVSGDPTLYAYDIFRSVISGTVGTQIGRVYSPSTVFTDTNVSTGVTYYYNVQAVDTSFNRSGYSNQAQGKAEAKLVAVTFRVRVPDYTPGYVFIAGNLPGWPQWNPGATQMTEVTPHIWEYSMSLPDGTNGEYKYTRGSWSTVEAWGTIVGLANRHVSISYGSSGVQLVDDTATDWGVGPDDHKAVQDWDDPLVVSTSPAGDAVDVPVNTLIQVVWNHSMDPATDFQVTGPGGPVTGTFAYDDATLTVTFTPSAPLSPGAPYTVLVTGQSDAGGSAQQVPYTWSFTTWLKKHYFPIIRSR